MPNVRNVRKADCNQARAQAQSGYNKGTIRSDIRYLVASKDVRRHRLISIDYISTLPCHGRGREFESRRPRHSFQKSCPDFLQTIEGAERARCAPFLCLFFLPMKQSLPVQQCVILRPHWKKRPATSPPLARHASRV